MHYEDRNSKVNDTYHYGGIGNFFSRKMCIRDRHIFEPFSQERNDSGSTQQGIGLGMSIVKGLIEKMGGTIKIKSEEGDVYKRQE